MANVSGYIVQREIFAGAKILHTDLLANNNYLEVFVVLIFALSIRVDQLLHSMPIQAQCMILYIRTCSCMTFSAHLNLQFLSRGTQSVYENTPYLQKISCYTGIILFDTIHFCLK